jgi:hypothetical protein
LQEQRRLGYTEDKFVVAAVANLLVGRDSTPFAPFAGEMSLRAVNRDPFGALNRSEHQNQSAKTLADTMIRRNDEIRFAAVMYLRTTGLIGGPEAFTWVISTIDWLGTVGELPGFSPNPDLMRRLAYDIALKSLAARRESAGVAAMTVIKVAVVLTGA